MSRDFEPVTVVCDCGQVHEQATEMIERLADELKLADLELGIARRQVGKLRAEQAKALELDKRYPQAKEILYQWRDLCKPNAREVLSATRVKPLLARLRGGYPEDELVKAIKGYAAFPYVTSSGRSTHGTPEQWRAEAELIFRSPEHVNRGLGYFEKAERLKNAPTTPAPAPAVGNSKMATAALGYAKFGWHVFPIVPNEKRPHPGSNGLLDATLDLDRIAAYWNRNPDNNIGVRTGAVSQIIVLDVDERSGGFESLRELEREFGELPTTLSVKTPSGGSHFYFQHPGGEVRNTTGYPAPGLDIRGDGGYVLAPPDGVDGRFYEVDEEAPIAPAPIWLRQKLLTYQSNSQKLDPQAWAQLITRGVKEGERNMALTRVAGKFLSYGMEPEIALGNLIAVNRSNCNPPLSDRECEQIVTSLVKRQTRLRNRAALQQANLESLSNQSDVNAV